MKNKLAWLPIFAAAGILAACTMDESGTPDVAVATVEPQDIAASLPGLHVGLLASVGAVV